MGRSGSPRSGETRSAGRTWPAHGWLFIRGKRGKRQRLKKRTWRLSQSHRRAHALLRRFARHAFEEDHIADEQVLVVTPASGQVWVPLAQQRQRLLGR